MKPVRGLGRNTVVFLTREGVHGVEIRSSALLVVGVVSTLFLVAFVYYETQAASVAIYFTLWIAASGLLYDELRWRGARTLGEDPPQAGGGRKSWVIPWQNIRLADWNGRTLWLTSSNPGRKLSATFDREDAPAIEGALNSNGVRYSWRGPRLPPYLTRFSTLALLVFVAGQVILILAATLPFFPGEAQLYTTVYNNAQNQIAGATFIGEFQDIFLNNVQVAWGGAMPFFGALAYGVTSYNTGRVIQVIATTYTPRPLPPYAVLIGLYLFPHTWVEESAYPIATVAGMLALTKWRSVSPREFAKRRNWGSAKLVFALGGATAILAAAGLIETLTSYIGYDALGVWVLLALMYYAWRRRRRTTPLAGSP